MLRRIISAMAITAAAVLAPAAVATADEYGPGEFPCTVALDSAVVTVGEPFGFTISCPSLPNVTVTVEIASAGDAAAADQAVEVAGTRSVTFTLDENGEVSGTATVNAVGDYTKQVFDEDGEPLSDVYTITAVAPGSPGGDGADGGGGGLAVTGATSLPYLAAAGGLLLLGVGALVVSRIRARRS